MTQLIPEMVYNIPTGPEAVSPDRLPPVYPRYAPAANQHRQSTVAAYVVDVSQAISVMYERFREPLTLQDMADSVALSPHHFTRVFRGITGTTPFQYLSAIRLRAAKQLLLTTDCSVTDICFEVGYNSPGSFVTRFTHAVGLAPSHLRELADEMPPMLHLLASSRDLVPKRPTSGGVICGSVIAPDSDVRYIFVGLFPTPIPQGAPLGCTLLTRPGPYQTCPVPDGRHYLFAVGLPHFDTPSEYLLLDPAKLRVGASLQPIVVRNGVVAGCADITLRTVRLTDPLLLSALPLLLIKSRSRLPT